MIYTPELIKKVAPSVFATSPSPTMSNRYSFVPTEKILEMFDREGWNVSSVKQRGKGIYSLHELRLRNGELPAVGDTLVEAIIRNSHNGMATFQVSAGLHRLACSNGLTVPTSVSESFRVRHNGLEMDDVKSLMDDFAKKLPKIKGSVERMMEREVTMDEKIEFAQKAAKLRWKEGSIPSDEYILDLLNPRRVEDKGDNLWKTFNVVQEGFIKGGLEYQSNRGRKTKLRSITDIVTANKINTQLWELAEEMI